MVRPIALQDNLAKTQAVERLNQIEKAHGDVGQKAVADSLKEKAAAEMERTKSSEKTDMVIIRKEEEEKQKQQDQRKKKEEKDSDSEKPAKHLDLRG